MIPPFPQEYFFSFFSSVLLPLALPEVGGKSKGGIMEKEILNVYWQEILPMYLRLQGKVDEDILNTAALETVEKYNPKFGITLQQYFGVQIKYAKMTDTLYAMREAKRIDYVENPEMPEKCFDIEDLDIERKKVLRILANTDKIPRDIKKKIFNGNKQKGLQDLPLFS